MTNPSGSSCIGQELVLQFAPTGVKSPKLVFKREIPAKDRSVDHHRQLDRQHAHPGSHAEAAFAHAGRVSLRFT